MNTIADIIKQHTNKYSFAADVQSRMARGERILEHDAFLCACGCGRVINLDNWDVDGADYLQPTGFYDDSCMQWFSNECGERSRKLCEGCVAYAEAEALIVLATSIRDSLSRSNERPEDALSALRDMLPIESGLGRRLRRLQAKQTRAALAACNEATCAECRHGAA